MIHCPKCGFEQPEDKYCAKCGVDMELYSPPKVSVGQAFGPILKSVFIFVGILAALFILLKSLNKSLNLDFIEEGTEPTQNVVIGTQAESLRTAPSPTQDIPTPEVEPPLEFETRTKSAELAPTAATPLIKETPKIIPQFKLSLTVSEAFLPPEFRNSSRVYTSQEPQILSEIIQRTLDIKNEPIDFRIEDELLLYDGKIQILKYENSNLEIKINLNKTLKLPTGPQTDTFEFTENLNINSYAFIADPVFRTFRPQTASQIARTLFQSQNYMSNASELSLVFHFDISENPEILDTNLNNDSETIED